MAAAIENTSAVIQPTNVMNMNIFLTLILSIITFSACQTASNQKVENTSGPSASNASNEIKQVTVTEAKQAVDAKDVQFIDVRTGVEFADGHAPQAINFPLDLLEKDLAKLNREWPVYVICQTGRRSQKASEILQKAGFNHIYNIQGGTSAWIDAALPIVK